MAYLRRVHEGGQGQAVLGAYYQSFKPSTAAEVLGVEEALAGEFATLPPTASVLPWISTSPAKYSEGRHAIAAREAEEHGFALSIEDGYNDYGPVSEGKLALEAHRLTSIYASMLQRGYVRHEGKGGDVSGTVLIDRSGSWCIRIGSGHHRIAAAAALGYESIPVRIRFRAVLREEVDYWPQVRAGRITRDGALAVFDRVMRGDPPPACQFTVADLDRP